MTTTKSYFRKLLALLVLAALGASMMILLASQAQAATFTVANTNDAGEGSLRQAIVDANATAEADTIEFAPTLSGQITLASQLPAITAAGGALTIDGGSADITISGNDMVRVFQVNSGALALENLTVADGSATVGGGIWNNDGTLTVTNSTFSQNNASNAGGAPGGGIANPRGATLTVTNSTFSANSSDFFGGGISNGGILEVTNSTFSGNSAGAGGGISNSQGTLTVTNSTFSKNSAALGGGLLSQIGRLTVTNSTFSANSATDSGGGISNVDVNDLGTLKNTIVANSTSGGNCRGNITDGGGNLDDGETCGFTASTSKSTTPAGLDPAGLQDNGGPTQTIALCSGVNTPTDCTGPSAAIDAAVNCPPPTTDQRGVSRPQGSACDIGAYEVEVEVVDTTPPTVTTTIPEDGALEVSRSTTVKATFSEPVQNVSPETFILERKIAVKKAPPKFVLVDATVSPSDDGLSAELTPVQDLPKGEYRVTVTTEVTDLADNALDQDSAQAENQPMVWTFTVAKLP